MQGALDGGLDVPHSEKRFPGFNKEDKSLNAETHRKYILGGHIADYMRVSRSLKSVRGQLFTYNCNGLTCVIVPDCQLLKEDEPEKYQSHFSGFIKEGVEAEDLADMYTKVHAAIRADPAIQKTEKKAPAEKRKWKIQKLTYDERQAALVKRLNAINGEDEE